MHQNFIVTYLYEVQHVSGDTPPIIRSPKLHRQPLVFHVWKTRGCQCSFRLLMMGGVSSETWWASYKYGIIKFWYNVASCWIFLYELYYDARIHEHQGYIPNRNKLRNTSATAQNTIPYIYLNTWLLYNSIRF